MTDFINSNLYYLFMRHRELGYSVRTSYRLARWCLEPEQ